MMKEINEMIADQKDLFAGNCLLDKTFDENHSERNVHIVLYQINTLGTTPFIQFVLHKRDETEQLQFIEGKPNDYPGCILLVEEVSRAYRVDLDCTTFKGTYREDDNYYLFFAFPDNTIDCHLLYSANDLWLITTHELLNCFFYNIDNHVKDFFLRNQAFSLLSKNGTFLETPMIVFHGCERRQVVFQATFGIVPKPKEIHPYEFCTLDYILKQTGNGALIRFAVFLGNMAFANENEKEDADSIFDNDNQIIRVANYEQIVPLSFHYLNYHSEII